jgi:outer membrane receptor protein involved in Fe transport
MKKRLSKLMYCFVFLIAFVGYAQAQQTVVSGNIVDETGEPLIGANVTLKGTVTGTITDTQGNFTIKTNTAPPFTVVFSSVGYTSQELEITGSQSGINIKMAEETVLGQEVVVSASRVEEKIMQAPVTVEKMDIIAIQTAPSPDFYDGIARLKGVTTTSGSLTFTSVNTRGFATIANTRFVQLIDGMDNSAPTLNFPAGNIVGISDLDVESVELVPGAASALYGPNAFNGILMMSSRSPFEYQGLSVSARGGVTSSKKTVGDNSTEHGTNPYANFSIRYAKAINDRFAFKVNFQILDAEDWRANDYTTFRTTQSNYQNTNNPVAGATDFDGLNMYGDETNIRFAYGALPAASQAGLVQSLATALAPGFAVAQGVDQPFMQALLLQRLPQLLPTYLSGLSVNRTGHKEEAILDNFNARSIKADVSLHYKINENVEASYSYRFGSGSSVYQGGERYALRDFGIQFHKLEFKGRNFFARAYASMTNDGDSYNLTALGTFANERLSPTQSSWFPTYLGSYLAGIIQANPTSLLSGIPATPTAQQIAGAHAFARQTADANRPAEGSEAYNKLMADVRRDVFKGNPFGAGFIDNSRFYHAEGNYNFRDLIDFAEIQVGGNYRLYDLYTANTIFNEVVAGESEFQRVRINEFGFYTQISKTILDDRLKMTGSIRYDKNENFKGQVTPRISVVYSMGEEKQHNIRASFQTGFRNPDTQAQFIFFPSSSGTLLGSTKKNAEPFGIHEGGARNAQGQDVFLRYLQPERLSVIEIGYKGLIGKKFLIDLNYYHNDYKDFISAATVFSKNGGTNPNFVSSTNPTGVFPAGTAFRPYVNADVPIQSDGVGVGITYQFYKKFVLNGNYSWAQFTADIPTGDPFEVGFNTPEHKYTIGLSNRELVKNLGFDISYRWQQEFLWQSAFGVANIPAYGTMDAQVSYKVKSIKSVFKLGATNLLGPDFRTNYGAPWVGKLVYLSITFDEFFKK